MDTIQITKANALKAYNEGCDDVKKVLDNLFGKETFVQKNITDRVGNFDDILAIKGITLSKLLIPGLSTREIAGRKAELIAEVYNEGVILDPMNTNQVKYFPWFTITPGSAFGLSFLRLRWLALGCGCRRPPFISNKGPRGIFWKTFYRPA